MRLKQLFQESAFKEDGLVQDGVQISIFGPGCTFENLKLYDLPEEMSEHFQIRGCEFLKTLEGNRPIKIVERNFLIIDNPKLESLQGSPEQVHKKFVCRGNPSLTTLQGAPKKVGFDVEIDNCKSLTSLKGIGKDYLQEINGMLSFEDCNIKSNVLGILKINGLKAVFMPENEDVAIILNKYIKSKDILSCHEELVDNGFEQYAQL